MKLLLDQGLPRSAAMLLQEYGYESFHVADLGLSASADEEILNWGRNFVWCSNYCRFQSYSRSQFAFVAMILVKIAIG